MNNKLSMGLFAAELRFIAISMTILITSATPFSALADLTCAGLFTASGPKYQTAKITEAVYDRISKDPDYKNAEVPEFMPSLLWMKEQLARIEADLNQVYQEQSTYYRVTHFPKIRELRMRLKDLQMQAEEVTQTGKIKYLWFVGFSLKFTQASNINKLVLKYNNLDQPLNNTSAFESEYHFVTNLIDKTNQIVFFPTHLKLSEKDFNHVLHKPVFYLGLIHDFSHADGTTHDVRHSINMLTSAFKDIFNSSPSYKLGKINLNFDQYVLKPAEGISEILEEKQRTKTFLAEKMAGLDPAMTEVAEQLIFEIFHEVHGSTYNLMAFRNWLNTEPSIFLDKNDANHKVVIEKIKQRYPKIDGEKYIMNVYLWLLGHFF